MNQLDKRRVNFIVATLSIFSVFITTVFALEEAIQSVQTPEMVAQAYFEALNQNRFQDFVKYIHPEALDKVKNLLLPVAEMVDKVGKHNELFFSLFDGVKDIKTLRKLNSRDFFLALYKEISKKIPNQQLLKNAKIQIIGHVVEGETLAHVVYRLNMTTQGITVTNMSVMSLQQDKTGWYILLTSEIKGMANMLKQRFSEK